MIYRHKYLLLLSFFRCYRVGADDVEVKERSLRLDFKETVNHLQKYKLGDKFRVSLLFNTTLADEGQETKLQARFDNAATQLLGFLPRELKKLYDDPEALEERIKSKYPAAAELYKKWVKSPARHFKDDLNREKIATLPKWLADEVREALKKTGIEQRPETPVKPQKLTLALVKQTLMAKLPVTRSTAQLMRKIEVLMAELEAKTGRARK